MNNTDSLWLDLRTGGRTSLSAATTATTKVTLPRTAAHSTATPLLEGRLLLDLEQSQLKHGYAYFCVEVGPKLSHETSLLPRLPLLSVVVATELATAPYAWRHILGDYVLECANSDPGETMNSVPPMPRTPWAVACTFSEFTFLPTPLQNEVKQTASSLARELLARAARAAQTARDGGESFDFDRSELPELDGLIDDEPWR
jgi:hypothetical protein